mgnify:CR=1 FL=1
MSNNKANGKNQKAIVLACPILSNGTPIGTDEKPAIVSIDCSNLSGSIGKVLDEMKNGTEIRILGSTVKIPSGTFSGKFNAIVTKLVDIAFEGCKDADLPKTAEKLAVIEGLKGKLHFESAKQSHVRRALQLRKAHFAAQSKYDKNEVDGLKENVVLISETKTYKDANKAFKEGGRVAVLKMIEGMKGNDKKLLLGN